MDYRDTEDFARRMEAAALRAPGLRAQAASAFWDWVFTRIAIGLRQMKTAAVRPFRGALASRLRGNGEGVTSLRSSGS
jgi:hypothetical protein